MNTEKEPVKDLTDLLHRLDCRAEKRELQTKDEMTKLIENNDENWKTRIAEDRKEILRIQDEKTDMKITQSEAKQNAEFEKLRKAIVDVKKESINLKASENSTTLLFGGLQDMTFEAAEKWVKDQIKDRTLEELSLVYHKADDFNGIIFAEFSTEKVAEHIARKISLAKFKIGEEQIWCKKDLLLDQRVPLSFLLGLRRQLITWGFTS